MNVEPIGWVHSPRVDPQDDGWDSVTSTITLDRWLPAIALRGLDDFSHIEVVYVFHRVDPNEVTPVVHFPRDDPVWPEAGVYSQRSMTRPNRIGVTVCRLVSIEQTTLTVEGLDALDGSPVLDIKPWVVQLLPRGRLRQPLWVEKLMINYWHRPDDPTASRYEGPELEHGPEQP